MTEAANKGTAVREEKRTLGAFLKSHVFDLTAYAGLAIMVILFLVFNSGPRLMYNVSAIVQAAAVYSIVALGAVFVYSMGFMDVSIGQHLWRYWRWRCCAEPSTAQCPFSWGCRPSLHPCF